MVVIVCILSKQHQQSELMHVDGQILLSRKDNPGHDNAKNIHVNTARRFYKDALVNCGPLLGDLC